ncbi:hypothetical protein DFJ74DRAFT_312094 [Hyaloraphidium curvatum]|nr:hypothetical protein DFJ74DRAFT_312094 [Hyaloraphidium curvatum]
MQKRLLATLSAALSLLTVLRLRLHGALPVGPAREPARDGLSALASAEFPRTLDAFSRPDAGSSENHSAEKTFGVAFYSWFSGQFGIAAGSRSFLRTLALAGIPVRACDAHDVVSTPHKTDKEAWEALLAELRAGGADVAGMDCRAPHGYFVSLTGVALDLLDVVFEAATTGSFRPDRDALAVAWIPLETEVIPRDWLRKLASLDGIWAHSEFVAATFRKWTALPVRAVRETYSPEFVGSGEPPAHEVAAARSELGFLPGDYVFLFTMDCLSSVHRKNPLGLVQAFLLAFPPGQPPPRPGTRPRLLLKAHNCANTTSGWPAVVSLASTHPSVAVVSRTLPPAGMRALFAACDAYASLHRAEGVGLGMYQALAMGKPVVATNYSGNLDFQPPGWEYLVPVRWPDRIGEGRDNGTGCPAEEGTYLNPGWPEPDVHAAAGIMRAIASDPDRAREVGRRGGRWVRRERGPEAAARNARAALEELWENRAALHAAKRMRARTEGQPGPERHAALVI